MKLVYPPAPSEGVLPTCRRFPNFLFDEDEDADADMKWQPPVSPDQREHSRPSQMHTSSSSGDPRDTAEGRGIHHVSSTIIIPHEDKDDDIDSHSLFRQALEMLNAAKDIAYVAWNVGWAIS